MGRMRCTRNLAVLLLILGSAVGAGASAAPNSSPTGKVLRSSAEPDTRAMQNDLQRLPWPKFRSIIESIPKLRAEVDAFGPAGWEFVKSNYRRYPWKKSLDRLSIDQKRQLSAMIEKSANSR